MRGRRLPASSLLLTYMNTIFSATWEERKRTDCKRVRKERMGLRSSLCIHRGQQRGTSDSGPASLMAGKIAGMSAVPESRKVWVVSLIFIKFNLTEPYPRS